MTVMYKAKRTSEDDGESKCVSKHVSNLERVSSRELMDGGTRSFSRFVKLNSNTPDLSIPELEKRIEEEESAAHKHVLSGYAVRRNVTEGAQCSSSLEKSKVNNSDQHEPRECLNVTNLKDISMPPKLKKRGRPKGHELTVIGLPAKKHKTTESKMKPFIKLHTSVKEKVLLKWLVGETVAAGVLRHPKELIEEESVEVKPELLPDGVLDENVDIHLIRRFFTNDAWLVVVDVIQQKQNNPVFVCKHCYHDLEDDSSIVCDHCLSWSHMKCVGLKSRPKSRYWFCRDCHKNPFDIL